MYIGRLRVRRFRSIYDLDLEQMNHQVNVFIGKNGSGKSNILGVIRTLKDCFTGHVLDPSGVYFNRALAPANDAGFTVSMHYNDSDVLKLISLAGLSSVLSDKERNRLHARLRSLDHELRFSDGSFWTQRITSGEGIVLLDDGTDGISSDALVGLCQDGKPKTVPLESGIMTPFVTALLEMFKDFFKRAFIYDPTSRQRSQLDEVLDEVARYSGVRNGILFPRHTGPSSLDETVLNECKRLVPKLEKVIVETDASKTRTVRFLLEGTDHMPADVSEGTRGILTLVLRLYDPDTSVVVTDSPENNIFPDAQEELFGIMKRSGKQVFLATHSIEFVSHEESVDVFKVSRRGHNASTVVERIEGAVSEAVRLGGTRLYFLERIVLVEGPTDKVVLEAYARMCGPRGADIAFIPCMGETNFKFFANVVNIQMLGVPLSKVQILTDGDGMRDKRHKVAQTIGRHYEQDDFVKRNGIGINVLPRFSIENFLEPAVLIEALEQRHHKSVPDVLKQRLFEQRRDTDIKSTILVPLFKVRKHELKGMTALYSEVVSRMTVGNTDPSRLEDMRSVLRSLSSGRQRSDVVRGGKRRGR